MKNKKYVENFINKFVKILGEKGNMFLMKMKLRAQKKKLFKEKDTETEYDVSTENPWNNNYES